MQDATPITPPTTARQGHSGLNILSATFITMIVVFVISGFSFLASVSLGSLAGFCIAAWNWFRMGRRRKALAHVLLGLGIYLGILMGYALLAILLIQVFPQSPPVETEFNLPGITSPVRMIGTPQIGFTIPVILIAYCIASGALVLLYLYRATAHDVPKVAPLEDGDELKRFLPLLAVAAISVAAIVFANILIAQIRTAQLQNRVYCELLQPGMTFEEVSNALNQIGSHKQAWFENEPYPDLSAQATSYTWIFWTSGGIDRYRDLDLWLGYDANDRLVWKGRHERGTPKQSSEDRFAAIECPWTFSQSVTAR